MNDAALEARLGTTDNPRITIQRKSLFHVLQRPKGIDATRVEDILHRLALANNSCCAPDTPPTRSNLYMGFGDVDPEDHHQAARLAKQLREIAYALWPHLHNPACQQMLDWIARDWALYEKSFQAPGTRVAMYRLHRHRKDAADSSASTAPTTGTVAATASTTTRTAPAGDPQVPWHKVDDASELRQRAHLRDVLIAALATGDTASVDALLSTLPPGVHHLSQYLPPALATKAYAAALRTAEQHSLEARTALSESLHAFVSSAQARSTAAIRVATEQHGLPERELGLLCAPDTRKLCLALRNVPESAMGSQANALQRLVTQALKNPSLEVDLTRQPYASLKVVLLKCTLLAEHLDKATMRRLRQHAQNAHDAQLRQTGQLRQRLEERPRNPAAIATLALSV
ncbi:hypothetical protein [Hydrogenophaga sp.]|uniref:hypothetical protein n=1 Tax=Hydrogenophaga sp. TaxID=1904254 RepID=UPI00271B7CC7|nr:hypothetical protein [Hydrogenophaga sp.]MDO9435013.1 hypothetical protein [Hydrogenophaga sp.]